ncbi:hypothetical protein AC1031_022141 [Aphanomyces cochlioides]|nr:hypothetical protein AC1031_022141 [Aphanomyces cochlioides]
MLRAVGIVLPSHLSAKVMKCFVCLSLDCGSSQGLVGVLADWSNITEAVSCGINFDTSKLTQQLTHTNFK